MTHRKKSKTVKKKARKRETRKAQMLLRVNIEKSSATVSAGVISEILGRKVEPFAELKGNVAFFALRKFKPTDPGLLRSKGISATRALATLPKGANAIECDKGKWHPYNNVMHFTVILQNGRKYDVKLTKTFLRSAQAPQLAEELMMLGYRTGVVETMLGEVIKVLKRESAILKGKGATHLLKLSQLDPENLIRKLEDSNTDLHGSLTDAGHDALAYGSRSLLMRPSPRTNHRQTRTGKKHTNE